jgi:hypothetical protein
MVASEATSSLAALLNSTAASPAAEKLTRMNNKPNFSREVETSVGWISTSVITSKAANGYHFKTGQRDWPFGTENVLPCRLLWWQVGFGAPASGAAFEHVAVVQ